ncbi:hypothetical protein JCM33374_g4147 [Metschnikowia sp. JCM 33374]|nr:hypothetical protein JCM33374_g4147 [Metschnikowia sp. JCM 33374]
MQSEKDPSSLYSLQRAYIIQQIKDVCKKGGLYALVLDRKTEAALLRVVTKTELLRIVTTVELIDDQRRIQKYMSAVYLVEPSVFNFNCILADVHTARYNSGVGLFVPFSQWDEQARRMFQSNRFLQDPAVDQYFNGGASVRFVHSSMVPVEGRVFLCDTTTPNAMPIYYNESCAELVLPQVRKTAKAIVNAIVVAGEYPLIRFYVSPQANHPAARLPELIADEVQRQLDDYARSNEDYPPQYTPDKPRAILLVSDRTMDLFAPLLHEFTYQAMAMDIIEGLERSGVYTYESENEKGEKQQLHTSLDSEDDETWRALRHKHIIEASESIVAKIGDLIKNNPMMVDRSRAKTSSDLMYVVAHLQGFDGERREVTLHKTLIDECLDINARLKLAEFAADFEQTCTAEGTSFEGEFNKHLHEDLIMLLARDDLLVNDKVRLVLMYSIYRGGLAKSDSVKLAKFIGGRDPEIVSLVSQCFNNLRKLNFPIVKDSVKSKKITRQMFHTINNEGTFNTSRFSPGLKRVLSNAAKYELDEEWFPYFRDKPLVEDMPNRGLSSQSLGESSGSLRNPRIKASWAPPSSRSSNLSSKKNNQRIFCFVAGGVTHSEIRSVYELSNSLNKDFFLGSESILKPRDFLTGLQDMDDSKNPLNLKLPLYTDLNLSTGQAPDHLFQVPKPAPSTSLASTPPNVPQKSAQQNAYNRFTPPLPQSKTQSNAPPHHQKKVNQYATDLTEGPVKEKKSSRLKKFFK